MSLQRSRALNDSQLSLASGHSSGGNHNKYNMNIGIPHNDHNHNYRANYLGQHQPQLHLSSNNGGAFKMPMNLEDLDDLLKYADEEAKSPRPQKDQQKQDIENGNEVEPKIKPKELLTAKGSNNSIGQMSNMCSSGYQSISTQSQSSSPVEATGQLDFLNNQKATSLTRTAARGNGPLKYQFGGTKATANAVLTRAKGSSLTPSSSEERLSEDPHYGHLNRSANNSNSNHSGIMIGEIRGESELNMITSALNSSRSPASSVVGTGGGRRGYNRTPRTNPLYYNSTANTTTSNSDRSHRTEDLNASLPYSPENGRQLSKHLNGSRFQRRLSLESARTLSDSSTDTEGECD